MNKADEIPCLRGVFILVGARKETDQQISKIHTVLGVGKVLERNQRRERIYRVNVYGFGIRLLFYVRMSWKASLR